MKKLILILITFGLVSTAFADKTIRIINNDKFAGMTLQTQNCMYQSSKDAIKCSDNAPIYIPSLHEEEQGQGKHMMTINIPDDRDPIYTFYNILSVSAVNKDTGKEEANAIYLKNSNKHGSCSVQDTGDIILLDSYNTNIVTCNNHDVGQPK